MRRFISRRALCTLAFVVVPFASGAAELVKADHEFIEQAAHSGQFEMQGSALAEQSAASEDVKSFARKMIEDHGKADKELKQLAERKGATLPGGLTDAQQEDVQKLSQLEGEEFDEFYAAHVGVKAHKEAVDLFEEASKHARDDDVKAFAKKTLPTLKEHQKMAQTLRDKVSK